ncbi:MAG TPA: GAP family protein [Mycobacterium sp.]|uniref:GAP family protein n=1 Tax=Mycolicibacterium sp. TaxID=2320850 RepID=UPI0025D59EE7|nr:GAP family protein [Mycolicibacterium sp.]HPX37261.1 GAP family protein [Mycobacterium sp.]HQC77499.1 GAP family protein [Mycobacterium sp.]
MSSHFAVLASLALAIFFSPETLVVGLVVAGDKKAPRLSAVAFAVGAIVGIAFATGIGLWIARASGSDETSHAHPDTWAGFTVRAVIAAVLLAIGLSRAINAMRHKPIPDPSETDRKPSRVKAWAGEHFPKVAAALKPGVDLPVRRRAERAALAGFAMCGLHPKVFPIAIAAGHQIMQIEARPERLAGIVMFAVISVIPAVTPAIIELVNPGASSRIKDGYERIMKVHGRWITASLLIAAALFVGHNAWEKMPR